MNLENKMLMVFIFVADDRTDKRKSRKINKLKNEINNNDVQLHKYMVIENGKLTCFEEETCYS